MFDLPGITARGDTSMLLVTDELASPADFILHSNLAAHLKDSDSRCVVLSASENVLRWKAIASKSSLNVPSMVSKGSLVFVDIEAELEQSGSTEQPSLRAIFDRTVAHFADEARSLLRTLLVVDDLSILEWIGFSTQEVCRFARALCAACNNTDTSLIIRYHVVTPGNPDELLRLLFQLCAYRLDVFPLSTGRSGSVSGQISLYPGPGGTELALKTIPRSKALLYRLTDTGFTLFQRGTGSSVL
ncbi:hypothetical protein BC835DRAFT_1378697 [Cytidiella melzeri]|nr:hypothetical protein BC835DRAFT_1378697 [Cytidiella melzeri]